MEFREFSAKTVDEAITKASIEFETSSENLEIQVVSQGKAGFLGFGAKPAIIKAAKKETTEIFPEEKAEPVKKSAPAKKEEKKTEKPLAAKEEKKEQKREHKKDNRKETRKETPVKVQEKPQEAEVIAVGPGGFVDGKEVEMEVEPGDKVIYSKYAGTTVKLEDTEYIIVKQSDILAIVED